MNIQTEVVPVYTKQNPLQIQYNIYYFATPKIQDLNEFNGATLFSNKNKLKASSTFFEFHYRKKKLKKKLKKDFFIKDQSSKRKFRSF